LTMTWWGRPLSSRGSQRAASGTLIVALTTPPAPIVC
jgi:hypothetical protein